MAISLKEQINYLITKIENDEENWIAVLKFREIKDPAAVPFLVQNLDHPHWLVRWCIIDTLGHLQAKEALPALLAGLKDGDQHVRHNALLAIERYGIKVIPELISNLKAVDYWERTGTIQVLESFNTKALPELRIGMLSNDWVIANKCAEILWRIGGVNALQDLINGLQNPQIQKTCIIALGTIHDPRAIEPLLMLLNKPNLRPFIVWACGEIGDSRVTKLLNELAQTDDYHLRVTAEEALRKLK